MLARAAPSPFEHGRALWWPHRLDEAALHACAAALPGRHDFTAFTPAQTYHTRFDRIVARAGWERRGDVLEFSIEADSFMRNMNRVLVGTMLEVANGRRAQDEFAALLDRPRRAPRPAAPPPRTGCTSNPWATEIPWGPMLRVLLTNDDGIGASGLQTLRRALVALEDVELAVVAPDSNRSATARSITFNRPLWVTEIEFGDGTKGYACDGTPVDCVRLAALGLIEGFQPDLIVSGINHGSNLGDDITYSGTVAAALEGVVLGVPGDRRLPAVDRARDGLPARRAVRLRSPRPRSPPGWSTRWTTSRCP